MMIDNEYLFNTLDDWNYWNKDALDLGVLRKSYIKKTLPLLKTKEVIVLQGVRRSGKSTFLKQLMLKSGIDKKQFLYVNLDDYRLLSFLSLELLEKIINVYREKINPDKKAYVIFDEIQNIASWEKFIKTMYDLNKNIKFIVTGSNADLISKEYGSFLTGRIISIDFYPFSFREFLTMKGVAVGIADYYLLKEKKTILQNKLEEYLRYGGFPEVLKEEGKMELLNEYFNNIINKDIITRYNIRDSNTLKQIAVYLATNIGTQLSYSQLQKTFKISINTIKEYLSHLEEANLFFLMNHFSYSTKTQALVNKKVYCIDNGLREAVSFKFSKDYGRLSENMVFIELKRRLKKTYYWKSKGEIDFVIKEKEFTAINVTNTDQINERENSPLHEFKAKRKILITHDTYKKEKEIEYIPLWLWLLQDG